MTGVCSTASLDAEGVALGAAALDIADTHDLDMPACQRRGQALKDIFRWFLDHQDIKTTGRRRPHLNIVIRDETIHTTRSKASTSRPGSGSTRTRCERLPVRLRLPPPSPQRRGRRLDYGRSVKGPAHRAVQRGAAPRPAMPRLRPARVVVPRPPRAVVGTRPRRHETRKPRPLCARCHGLVHRNGWTAVLHPDGQFDIITPWGESEPATHPTRYPDPNSTGTTNHGTTNDNRRPYTGNRPIRRPHRLPRPHPRTPPRTRRRGVEANASSSRRRLPTPTRPGRVSPRVHR